MPTVFDLATTLAQAKAGQPTAIQTLYTEYGPRVQRYCYVRLRSVEAAEECTQEVFISIWKHVPTFEYRGEGSFTAWLYTIANHVVISYLRKAQRVAQVALTSEIGLVDSRTSDTAGTICEQIVLRAAIAQLTAEQQAVIMLKFFGGLSNAEIAAQLGCTEGAVKALQYRAVRSLHRQLTAAPADQLAAA